MVWRVFWCERRARQAECLFDIRKNKFARAHRVWDQDEWNFGVGCHVRDVRPICLATLERAATAAAGVPWWRTFADSRAIGSAFPFENRINNIQSWVYGHVVKRLHGPRWTQRPDSAVRVLQRIPFMHDIFVWIYFTLMFVERIYFWMLLLQCAITTETRTISIYY